VGVFYGFFVADAGEAEALDYDTYAFMVEVRHDDYISSVTVLRSMIREGESNIPLKP
jgi:hypothetical protein